MLNDSVEISEDLPMFDRNQRKKLSFDESISLAGGFGPF